MYVVTNILALYTIFINCHFSISVKFSIRYMKCGFNCKYCERQLLKIVNSPKIAIMLLRGLFQHLSVTEVIDGWQSFSALCLYDLLHSTVKIPNYQAHINRKTFWYLNTVLQHRIVDTKIFLVILCSIIWNVARYTKRDL